MCCQGSTGGRALQCVHCVQERIAFHCNPSEQLGISQ
jgi:hypothetical protein